MSALILGLLEDEALSKLVINSLELAGHRVQVVSSFGAAMKVLEQPHSIDLIISDVHLENGGNVFDFLRWIKKNPSTKQIPFVLFSCSTTKMALHLEDGIRTAARMLGAAMFIGMHEFDSEQFQKQTNSLLAKSGVVKHDIAKGRKGSE